MELSTVIVNYRSRDPLLGCLAALEADAAERAHEILIVDNSPGDGMAEAVRARYPSVRILTNSANVGFARAVNRGVSEAAAPVVLLLNPDCELQRGAIPALLEHLRRHPRCAIAAPRLHNTDGTLEYSARAYPDHLTFLFNRYSLLTRLFPGNPWSRRYLLTDWDHESVRDVDWVSGACMAVRREAVRQVGPMDDGYFMFNEDVDWCRRMNQAGWKVAYVPQARATHHVGASKSRVSPKLIWERHRGMIHYFHKHHPSNPLLRGLADALIMTRASLMIAANALKSR